jgi:hypothetical protein
MKILKSKRAANINGKLVFQLSPVAAGCAVFLSAMAANVYAQAQETTVAPAADSQQALDSNGKPIASVVVRIRIRSLKRSPPKTSASCRTPPWPSRSRACRA